MRKRNRPLSILFVIVISLCMAYFGLEDELEPYLSEQSDAIELVFPSERYPETARHVKKAIEAGHSPVCTIDRDGAEHNRDQSLQGVATKEGYDRDEWPMAMCAEGGAGASVEYVSPADNRGAGSWVGNKLKAYPDGTRILFVVP